MNIDEATDEQLALWQRGKTHPHCPVMCHHQIGEYDDRGFTVVTTAIDAERLVVLREVVDGFRATDHKSWLWATPDDAKHGYYYDVVGRSMELLGLCIDPFISDLVEPLIEKPISLYCATHVRKPATASDNTVPFHQDFPVVAPRHRPQVYLALDDCDIRNGCVRMVPGSHKLGPLPHRKSRLPHFSWEVDRDCSDAVPIALRAGQAIVFHPLVIHGSFHAVSAKPRRVVIFTYQGGPDTAAANGAPSIIVRTG